MTNPLDKLRSRLALLMVWGGWSYAKAQKHMDDARARTEFTAFDGTAAADQAELPKSIVNVGGLGSRVWSIGKDGWMWPRPLIDRDDLHSTIVQTLTRHAGLPTYELADQIVDAIEETR